MGSLDQASNVAIINSVGAVGSKSITGTNAVTPPTGYYFFCLQFTEDSAVTTQTNVTGSTNATLSDFAFTGGTPVYGKWLSVTLASGKAIGYLARL